MLGWKHSSCRTEEERESAAEGCHRGCSETRQIQLAIRLGMSLQQIRGRYAKTESESYSLISEDAIVATAVALEVGTLPIKSLYQC